MCCQLFPFPLKATLSGKWIELSFVPAPFPFQPVIPGLSLCCCIVEFNRRKRKQLHSTSSGELSFEALKHCLYVSKSLCTDIGSIRSFAVLGILKVEPQEGLVDNGWTSLSSQIINMYLYPVVQVML